MTGPSIRTDIVEIYVFHRHGPEAEILQVQRARPPQLGAWHPVLGHIEPSERAIEACIRELMEETGLDIAGGDCLGIWALEQVNPFFLASEDAIVLSPRFVVEATPGWSPVLNDENSDFRWIGAEGAQEAFVWPGQRAAVREAMDEVIVGCRYPTIAIR